MQLQIPRANQGRATELQGGKSTMKEGQYHPNSMVHELPSHPPSTQGWVGKQTPFPDRQTRSLSQLHNHSIILL